MMMVTEAFRLLYQVSLDICKARAIQETQLGHFIGKARYQKIIIVLVAVLSVHARDQEEGHRLVSDYLSKIQ